MPRFEFKGSFYFASTGARTQFATDVGNYITAHPNIFRLYPGDDGTVNRSQNDHDGVTYQLVRAHLTLRQDLDALFTAMKTQAQTRGAIAPSTMWLKQVADAGGVTDAVAADAPGWVNYVPVT